MDKGVQRWAVNVSLWTPSPHQFRSCLSLLPPCERSSVVRYVNMPFFFFFFRIFSGSGDRGLCTCHCRGIVSGTLYTCKDFLWNFTLAHIVSGIWDFFFQAVCWFSSFFLGFLFLMMKQVCEFWRSEKIDSLLRFSSFFSGVLFFCLKNK
jgi:hypothetical protein